MNPHFQKRADNLLASWSQTPTESKPSAGGLNDIAEIFRLLSDETRLKVLALLMPGGELNVRSLCEQLEQSQPAVSHHLALLRTKGLIRIRREGKHNYYHLVPDRLNALLKTACQRLLARHSDMPQSSPP
jgi:DNA-binding transcriptional ArsR family regulator